LKNWQWTLLKEGKQRPQVREKTLSITSHQWVDGDNRHHLSHYYQESKAGKGHYSQ
jgi:hypothetical protein